MTVETLLNGHIARDEAIRSGKPHITGTRVTVADIVIMHRYLRQSLEEIAGKYNLPLAAVYAAMTYYYDHQSSVDSIIKETRAFAENLQNRYPSRIKTKLVEVSHG
jgi:uncharacterized protein (DUF433 family)